MSVLVLLVLPLYCYYYYCTSSKLVLLIVVVVLVLITKWLMIFIDLVTKYVIFIIIFILHPNLLIFTNFKFMLWHVPVLRQVVNLYFRTSKSETGLKPKSCLGMVWNLQFYYLINPYVITKYVISPFKYHVKYYYDYNNYQYHLSKYQQSQAGSYI